MAEDAEKKKEAEDATAAPVPEKVNTCILDSLPLGRTSLFFNLHFGLQVQVGGGPTYILDKKLGKGGFGQVYLGKRVPATKDTVGQNANQVSNEPCASVVSRGPQPSLFLTFLCFLPNRWLSNWSTGAAKGVIMAHLTNGLSMGKFANTIESSHRHLRTSAAHSYYSPQPFLLPIRHTILTIIIICFN